MPSSRASRLPISPGAATSSSGTKTAPSAKRAASSSLARRAKRVLPMPPGPTTLTSRQSSCASSSAMRRNSSARPTKPSSCAPVAAAAAAARGRGDGRRAERIVQRFEFGAWREPQLGGQPADECLIGLAGARALPVAREPQHVRAQRRFVERVGLEQPRRQLDAFAGVDLGAPRRSSAALRHAVRSRSRSKSSQLVHASLCPSSNPGRSSPRAERQRLGDAAVAQCGLEVRHVGRGDEAQRAALRLDAARVRHPLQAEQRLAQVGVGELRRLIGPEHRRQLRAPDPRALQRQQYDELIAPLERQRERLARDIDPRRAEKMQANRHGGPGHTTRGAYAGSASMRISAATRKRRHRRRRTVASGSRADRDLRKSAPSRSACVVVGRRTIQIKQ